MTTDHERPRQCPNCGKPLRLNEYHRCLVNLVLFFTAPMGSGMLPMQSFKPSAECPKSQPVRQLKIFPFR